MFENPEGDSPDGAIDSTHCVVLQDRQRQWLASIYGVYHDGWFQVVFGTVRWQRQGIYTRLLRSLQVQMHIRSDMDGQNSAAGCYRRLGARHVSEQGGRFILERRADVDGLTNGNVVAAALAVEPGHA